MRKLDRPYDPALTWAGKLALLIPEISRRDLQAEWEGADARAHLETLKRHVPGAYIQLVTHVKQRVAETR